MTPAAGLHRTLGLIAHGRHDATMRFDRDSVWRASRTPEGPGTIRVRLAGPERVVAEAWGPGSDWLIQQASALAGMSDEPSGFDASAHPVVDRIWRELGGFRFPCTGRIFEAAIPTILAQKVTAGQAIRAWHGLVRLLGEPAPGPVNLLLPPDPDRVAALPYYAFHPLGVERRRADVIRMVAAHASRLEEDVDRLGAIPGVGPWTIAKVRTVALGDPDAVEVGDFHLPHLVAWALAGEPRATDSRMLELLAPWAGQRGRVVRLIAMGASHPPRYGARLAPRLIAWH